MSAANFRAIFRELHPTPHLRRRHLISPAEALAILPPELLRNPRLAVFLAVHYVGPAVIAKVLTRAFNALLESASLPLAKSLRRSPLSGLVLGLPGRFARQLRRGHFIPAHKAFAVLVSQFPRHRRVAEFLVVVGIGPALGIKVLARFFYAFAI